MGIVPNLTVDQRGLHEAAHAVAAVEAMMVGITVRLVHGRSRRNVITDADITYSCPQLHEEPLWGTLRRRLFVVLAGPAWEAFMSVKATGCQAELEKQRDDRLAALSIVRQLVSSGIKGDDLKHMVAEAWAAALELMTKSNQQIMAISR